MMDGTFIDVVINKLQWLLEHPEVTWSGSGIYALSLAGSAVLAVASWCFWRKKKSPPSSEEHLRPPLPAQKTDNQFNSGGGEQNIAQDDHATGKQVNTTQEVHGDGNISSGTGDVIVNHAPRNYNVSCTVILALFIGLITCASFVDWHWLAPPLTSPPTSIIKSPPNCTPIPQKPCQSYDAQGDYTSALKCYKQHLSIRQEIGDKRGEAVTSWNIGMIYKKYGDLTKAEPYMSRAVQLAEEIGHPKQEEWRKGLEELRAKLRGNSARQ